MENVGGTHDISFQGVANEKIFARKRIDHLKAQKNETLAKLLDFIQENIHTFYTTQDSQNNRLNDLKDKVT